MQIKVAYSGYDGLGKVDEFEFDWNTVSNVPFEEANTVQIEVAVLEAIHQKTERENRATSFVILGDDPYDRLKDIQ